MKTKLIIIALLIFASCAKEPTQKQSVKLAGIYSAEIRFHPFGTVNCFIINDQQTIDYPTTDVDQFLKIQFEKVWVGDKIIIVANSNDKGMITIYRNDSIVLKDYKDIATNMELTVICY